jgi:hypothetical protein
MKRTERERWKRRGIVDGWLIVVEKETERERDERRGIREILGLESNEEKVERMAERWCFRESADEENIKLRVD